MVQGSSAFCWWRGLWWLQLNIISSKFGGTGQGNEILLSYLSFLAKQTNKKNKEYRNIILYILLPIARKKMTRVPFELVKGKGIMFLVILSFGRKKKY